MADKELEARIEALEERVGRLKDIEEIKGLVWNYTYFLDYAQLDKILDCFADDAKMEVRVREGLQEGPYVGRYEDKKAIESVYTNIVARYSEAKDRPVGAHLIQNPVVTVDGKKAKGKFYLFNPGSPPTGEGEQAGWSRGIYEQEFVKVDGKWKISSFAFTFNVLPT